MVLLPGDSCSDVDLTFFGESKTLGAAILLGELALRGETALIEEGSVCEALAFLGEDAFRVARSSSTATPGIGDFDFRGLAGSRSGRCRDGEPLDGDLIGMTIWLVSSSSP